MKRQESGRKGGLATRDRHITLCPLCGSPTKSQFYKETGARGGEATFRKYGREFYSNIGQRGGRGNTEREKGKRVMRGFLPLPTPTG